MKKALFILVLSVLFLGLISLIQSRIPVLKDRFRPIDFVGWMKKDTDEIPALFISDCNEESCKEGPEISSGTMNLLPFFRALKRIESNPGKETVRVFYFSDSMNEGDLITQNLRDTLQKKFGGSGVGFVPLTSITNGFRGTVKHSFSEFWDYSCPATPLSSGYFGISCESFLSPRWVSPENSWVEYKTSGMFPGTSRFERIRLLYGNCPADSLRNNSTDTSAVIYCECNDRTDTLRLNHSSSVNQVWLCQGNTNAIKINFNIPPDMPVFGCSFESWSGLLVDNFALRGSSGINLKSIPEAVMKKSNQLLGPDLIVLHYGLNMVSAKVTDFSWFEKGMEGVMKKIKDNFPGVPVLIISLGDKATKIEGKLQTDPSVKLILASQEKIAKENESAFLNLFSTMGGEGTIIQWADSKPSLANKDYTHPNSRGCKKISDMIFEFLMKSRESLKDSLTVLTTDYE